MDQIPDWLISDPYKLIPNPWLIDPWLMIRCSAWIRSLTDWFLIPTDLSLIPDWLIPDWWSGAAHGSDPWLIDSCSLLIYPWSPTDWPMTDDQVQRMDQIPDWLVPDPYWFIPDPWLIDPWLMIRCSAWIRSLTDWFLFPTNLSLIPDWLTHDWWSGAAHGSDPWLIDSCSLLIYPWSPTDWPMTDDQVQRMDQISDWLIPVPY